MDNWRVTPYIPVACYLALVGLIGLLTGSGIVPTTLHEALPRFMVTIWTTCVSVGGLACTAGAATRRPSVESAGLAALAWGAFLYGVVVAWIGYPYSFGAAAVALTIMLMCALRLRELSHIRRADRSHRLAARVQNHRGL